MIMNIRIVFSLLAVLLLTVSCCTQRTVHSGYASSSSAAVQIVYDSVFVCDSILLIERADTVFQTRTRIVYRDRIRIDTLWQCDTVICFKESVLAPKQSDGKLYCLLLLIAFLSVLFTAKKLFK